MKCSAWLECRKCKYRPKNIVFGGLGWDFCKDTYEAKLFGMHIGSVLSGLDAGNENTDAKISIAGFGDVCV